MKPVPILMYHSIGKAPSGAGMPGLYVTVRSFRQQMRFLRLLGFQGLTMSEALPYITGEKSGKVVAITFDDGYVDNLESALPCLAENDFRATCYVVSDRIGKWNEWDESALGVRKSIMTVAQLREWRKTGMEVGAHTRTHPFLTKCRPAEMSDEIAGCRKSLEDNLGSPISHFCYPYGDFNDTVVQAVRDAAFTSGVTTQRSRATHNDDVFRLPRVLVSGSNLFHLFALKTLTSYEDSHR